MKKNENRKNKVGNCNKTKGGRVKYVEEVNFMQFTRNTYYCFVQKLQIWGFKTVEQTILNC